MLNVSRLFFLIFLSLTMASSALAQASGECESTIIVKPGETLASIALREYGEISAYKKIVDATNIQSGIDRSYARITNPDVIEIGQKLCLPGKSGSAPIISPTPARVPPGSDVTRITFLQINDVYEMTPVGGQGGVARLATLQNQLKSANPNTYSVLSGDLFSPSALGTAKVDGKRLAGKQMVAAMNAFGLDFATLGNHEFDIKEDQFRDRISESETQWFSSNVFEADGKTFPKISQNLIFSAGNASGQNVTVGMFGLTLDSNPVSYVSYTDPFEAAASHISALKDHVDVLVAVTHLPMDQDIKLAEKFPDLDLIIGGHEHENAIKWAGVTNTPITKADANARTAYIIDIDYNHANDQIKITPRLKAITSDIPDDPDVARVVDVWLNKAFDGFKKQGFAPTQQVTNITEALDGTEASVRNQKTTLTQLIADGMLANVPGADVAMFNGGSIRIDDTITPGPLTEYDVIRILPFGGTIISTEMTGTLLQKTLDQGARNKGIGGYLQTSGASGNIGAWLINGEPLEPSRKYNVAVNDFLLTGKEQNLDFLTEDNPELTVKASHDDLRKALIAKLQDTYSAP